MDLPEVEEEKIKMEHATIIKCLSQKAQENLKLSDFSNIEENRNRIQLPKNSFINQFIILMQRSWLLAKRDQRVFYIRIIMTIFNAILVALVFWQLGMGDFSVLDRKGVLYFIAAGVITSNLQSSLQMFVQEKPKFYKEQSTKMYGVAPFFLSKTLIEIPIQLILAVVTYLITYFAVGLNDYNAGKHFFFILTIYLGGYTGATFGFWEACLFDNMLLLPAIFPFLLYTQIQSSGYFVTQENTFILFYPFKYFSIFRYSYQSLCYNEFNDINVKSDFDCNDNSKCALPMDNFTEGMFWSVFPMVIMAVIMNILSIITLKLKVYLRKF
jgi:hypothetical protein